ncbi:uncharacterized protein C3orf67 homolog isoform X1 [Anguilla anguilla]|uniref:uncharacterized protein C3orf67 homolog isoform X1 n=1 Tax=Anguilla anguilla TaxID=7936 RepID=UPI0015ABC481|nr:uncharacterized protein C3orf67 homolog isoform X1 [Anguilla anguilla]
MFKNEYQGGAVVDIFSAQGNDPVANWKLYGSQTAISKEFDREMKGFVYILEGSSQKNRMQMPKDSRMALGLSQRFLVLQVFVPMGKDFSTELMVTDSGNLKKRLYLSTIHKDLSATPLHAKIPLSSLRLNIWCNMCVDLVSFTSEIFKGAPFLSLDRITVSASCRLRRIFTMKLQPADAHNESDLYICGNGPRDIIPKGCQFPPDVQHITQLVNMNKLRLAEMKLGGSLSSDLEQANSGSSISARGAKNQDVCHIAFGSKVPGPPPPTGKKAIGSGSREVVLIPGARAGRSCGSAKQNSGDWVEKQSHRREQVPISEHESTPQHHQDSGQALEGLTGNHWSLQPHPPPSRLAMERPGTRKLRVYSAERENPGLTAGSARSSSRNEASSSSSETCPPSGTANTAIARVPGAMGDQPDADSGCFASSLKDVCLDSSKWTPDPLNLQFTHDSIVQTDITARHENNGVEPQLSLDDIFTFSSRPHSAKRCQGHINPGEGLAPSPEMWGEGGGAHRGARLEDDFFGSESEEDESYSATVIQRPGKRSCPGVSPSLSLKSRIRTPEGNTRPNPEHMYYSQASESPTQPSESDAMLKMDVSLGDFSSARKTEVDRSSMVPTRCLSPNRTRLGYSVASPRNVRDCQDTYSRISLSKKSVKEIPIGDSRLHVDHTAGSRTSLRANRASGSKLCVRESLGNQEEELLMLASLLRQQEAEREEVYEEGTPAGLSASQIHNCNVSISTSSDDTSTWTPYAPMPAYQGHHYQEEMSPLLQSNPRDRLNVLSPPIVPPSQEERGKEIGRHPGNTLTDAEISTSVEHVEDDFLNLLYDPCLNCYFDPESGKYYELV